MKESVDCIHCYLKQCVSCMNLINIKEDVQKNILLEIMDDIKEYDRNATPAENSTLAILKSYELNSSTDPYKNIKKETNDFALNIYPKLEKINNEANENKLLNSLKLAAAGNVIDLGIHRDFDIDEAINHIIEMGFSKNHFDLFEEKLSSANKIMILGDNSGEIVFDKILINRLKELGKEIVYVVKEGPILNDATTEDAAYVGIDKLCKLITNGSNFLGTCINKVSKEFLNELDSCNLVIAKGQANFETLEGEDISKGKIFFLLRLKCDHVANIAGGNYLDFVFMTR